MAKKPLKKTNKAAKKPEQRKQKLSTTPRHMSFLAVLALFSGFSLYAITSFSSSTSGYIDQLQTSVLLADMPVECETCSDVPVDCETCSDFSVPYEIFKDVMSDHVHANALEKLLYAGIINGYEDGTFKPDNNVNRAELLTILTSATDADLSGVYSDCFTDVGDQWFSPFVCYAKAQGWVNGYDDGSYHPGQNVIKAEGLKIVMEAFDIDVPSSVSVDPFVDVPAGAWYSPYAALAKDVGIVSNKALFDPEHEVTRAEFVQMIYNTMVYLGLM
ncbi:S-layer homology domain-containing protein [Candidatus Gracilibacteria bacterium]|nr:S-layer homology domain-containing protein [Candidatus Gracilibacteria bacterium]